MVLEHNEGGNFRMPILEKTMKTQSIETLGSTKSSSRREVYNYEHMLKNHKIL